MSSNPPPSHTSQLLGRISDAAMRPRPVWSSGRAYVISAVAGVVGLGAIWRFPYLVGENGGGAFLIAYLVCVVAVAIPLATLESSAGYLVRESPVGLFRQAGGRLGYLLGWTIIAVIVVLMSYYFVISGWTLGYAADAFRQDVRTFPEFSAGHTSLWLLFAMGLLVFVVLLRGVGAVEAASRVLVPLLALAVGGLAIYALTLDGAGGALRFYLGVDWDYLWDPTTWRAAAGQAFYQVGIGQGFLIAYGSYSPAGLNMLRSSSILAGANVAVSFVAGLMIFPIVFTYDIAPDAGAELAFTAFPQILGDVSGGAVIGTVFFVLLFVAAFTSCMGGAAVAISAVRDEFKLGPRTAALAIVLLIVALGIPSGLSYTDTGLDVGGQPFLEVVDQAMGSGIVIAVGLIGSSLIAWRFPAGRLLRAMRSGRRSIGPVVVHGAWIITFGRVLPPLGLLLVALSLIV